ncbi:uncharacterized protein LOC101864384 [Aplysia californica]|uniref:Glycine N-acyltransferase-like protein n=1 Tax=Aplysia californica TaxID=6500 RepID=A0ABM0JML1_APLCA|nr:uncharacterized protein LOC101864384 [Aplysia californica]
MAAMPELVRVKDSDLPRLRDWLASHLPHSWKLYGRLVEEMSGRWRGQSFYVLGWPEILAVAEGEVDPEVCKVPEFVTSPRMMSIFSPNTEHAETLLTSPGFIDWTQICFFKAVPEPVFDAVLRVIERKGGPPPETQTKQVATAQKEDLRLIEPPEGYTVRSLDPDQDLELVQEPYRKRKPFAEDHIRELIRAFPSTGLFDSRGECVGVELGSEHGFLTRLHVNPSMRGRGLSKVIVSQQAKKYQDDGLPVVTVILVDNVRSLKLHSSLGFKHVCKLYEILYLPDDSAQSNELRSKYHHL